MKQLERPSFSTICLNKDPNWVEVGKIKKIEKIDQRRKGFKPSPFGKGTRGHTDKNYDKRGSINSNGERVSKLPVEDGIVTYKHVAGCLYCEWHSQEYPHS